MTSLADSVRLALRNILVFVGAIWAAFALSFALPINDYGLAPRTAHGLIGILTMPLLHANLAHLIANTIPLVVLLILLAGSRARWWEIVAETIVLGGALLWLFGRKANHIGASGLVFGLIAFLILAGCFERRVIPILVAVATFLLYGSTLLWGVLPAQEGVSWDGHLWSAVAGGLLAFRLAKPPQPSDSA